MIMVDYKKFSIIYPDANDKAIALFDMFRRELSNGVTEHFRNRDLDKVRRARDAMNQMGIELCDSIDQSHLISENYYQHRHNLYATWRDITKNYRKQAEIICRLACGELNMTERTLLSEVAVDIYVRRSIPSDVNEYLSKDSTIENLIEIWGVIMDFDNDTLTNVAFGDEQYKLPLVEPVGADKDEVVAYWTPFGVDELNVDLADQILESWCENDGSIENMVLLTTQPLFSNTMKEDGLIGSFVAQPNMGKSLYSAMLALMYHKVVTAEHRSLSDKGYLFQDLMANIVTNGRDFTIFQETDGISSNAVAALKPLVTYTDFVTARFFGSKSMAASYHGSIVLTSNYVNKFKTTSDLQKRFVNIKFKFSPLVQANVDWLKTKKGAVSFLMACLKRRARMYRLGYRQALDLKKEVNVTVRDSVSGMDTLNEIRDIIIESGFLTGRELTQLTDGLRGAELASLIEQYGLRRARRSSGMVYTPTPNGLMQSLITEAQKTLLVPTKMFAYTINQSNRKTIVVDQYFKDLLCDVEFDDPEIVKASDNMFYIVAETNGSLRASEARSFNKIIIDYDNTNGKSFYDVVARLTEVLGHVWFAVWETPRSTPALPRVRVMIMLSDELPASSYRFVADKLDRILDLHRDPTCSVVQKQGLAVPWLNRYVNSVNRFWEVTVDGEETVRPKGTGKPTAAPDYEMLKVAFRTHVQKCAENIDDYYFWMRTYLIPLSRYVCFDKSITLEQGKELIAMTTDDIDSKLSNIDLLEQAVARGAGEEMFDAYNNSIMQYFADGDTSFDGFVF